MIQLQLPENRSVCFMQTIETHIFHSGHLLIDQNGSILGDFPIGQNGNYHINLASYDNKNLVIIFK